MDTHHLYRRKNSENMTQEAENFQTILPSMKVYHMLKPMSTPYVDKISVKNLTSKLFCAIIVQIFTLRRKALMKRTDVLRAYYESHDEDARFESKRGKVEFLTTLHYIEKYLKPGMRILEIGAGTGRYSHTLAQKGYKVDAIELTECNIKVFRAKTLPGEDISIQQGDAINLENIPSDTYDITLLLGPMYHLYTDCDKHAAISEAIRVTKNGGIVFAAYCNNDMTAYTFGFMRDGFKIESFHALIDFDTFKLDSTPKEIFSLYRKEDVDELMRGFNVQRLHYVGTDMLTVFIGDTVDNMDRDTFDMYMKYHLCICERADMVGATSHMLDIFKKIERRDQKNDA